MLLLALMVLPAHADMYLNSGVPRGNAYSLHLDAESRGINQSLAVVRGVQSGFSLELFNRNEPRKLMRSNCM